MPARIGGFRRRTRHKLQKDLRAKGKISLTRYFAKFKEGDVVQLCAESAIQKGMYFPRFHGKCGTVTGIQGKCLKVKMSDRGLAKMIIVHPVHVKKV